MAHTLCKNSLLWCCACLATSCYAVFCPISSTDCSQPGAPCTIIRDETCSLSTQMGKKLERYPGPVTSFSVTTKYVDPEVTSPSVSQSNLLVKWNLPANGTYRYLNGFEVRIMDTMSPSPHCFIFKITEPTWNFDTLPRQYLLNCTTLAEGSYQMEVRSLPIAPFSRMRAQASVYIKRKLAEDAEGCSKRSCWVSDLVVYSHPCNRSVTVSFNMAPPDERIMDYIVSLLKPDSLFPKDTVTVPQFENPTLGIATLKVPKSVKTAIIKLIPRGVAPQYKYTVTRSELFTIPDVDYRLDCTFDQPQKIETRNKNNSSTYAITGIILGSVLVAVTAVTTIVLLASHRNRIQREDGTDEEISTSCSQQALVDNSRRQKKAKLRPSGVKATCKRKIVLLLYANDNKPHQNVVGCFKQFLSRNCHCDVIYDVEHQRSIPDNKSIWIRQAMESADFILMICSEGAYHRARAIQNRVRYPPNDCESCLGDMFTLAFQILLEDAAGPGGHSIGDKLILAHFSYTTPEFRSPPLLPDVQRKKNYRLMDDVESLCTHIHAEVPARDRAACCPDHVSDLSYDSTTEGQQLAQAISYSERYHRGNSDWFLDIHGRPSAEGQHPFPTVSSVIKAMTSTNNNAYADIRSHLYLKPTIDQLSMGSSALGDVVADINRYG